MSTADNQYKYSEYYHGNSLEKWISEAHKYMCESNMSNKSAPYQYTLSTTTTTITSIITPTITPTIIKKTYEYDELCMSLGNILRTVSRPQYCEVDFLAKLGHIGWCENYICWKKKQPTIETNELNTYAKSSFSELPTNIKENYRILAWFIKETLSDRR